MQRLVNDVCTMVLRLECQYCSEFIRDFGFTDTIFELDYGEHKEKKKKKECFDEVQHEIEIKLNWLN